VLDLHVGNLALPTFSDRVSGKRWDGAAGCVLACWRGDARVAQEAGDGLGVASAKHLAQLYLRADLSEMSLLQMTSGSIMLCVRLMRE
jgi:hypothetical protein